MNMFVFCHQVLRSKGFDSENMFVYLSVGLVIYKFIYILNETSKPPVNTTHFFNIAHLLLNCLT